MLFTSPIVSQASGSVAGLTFSHCRGSKYVKSRVTPTDPSSTQQQYTRVNVGMLAPYWGQGLTSTERAGWDLYASNIAMTNALGETIYLTGQQHFIRCNTVRLQGGIAILDAAPTIYDLGTFTAPTFTHAWFTPEAGIGFDNTDDWATAVGGYLLAWPGRAHGQGRTFYKGPWRYGGKEAGAVSPPSSPFSATPDWPWPLGTRVMVKVRIIQVDGRLSLPVILGPRTVTTP